ncbi:hypothetical protein QAD02_006994 [Eretmocerus hayati]|uniref:Uncharacterized protein n=1 Tax=Eretmocerus hayati TaxID=131215 RepID=A0ACC2N2S1_9HYME|nr:hypothetical protein QAD02_006994 [Eretmocerus hayati]
MGEFRLSNYDCIGFDLDSTIIHYNKRSLFHLVYDLLTSFLVAKKNYNPKYFDEPLNSKDLDFVRKGLFMDFHNGNILSLTTEGKVHHACHGTKVLSPSDIEEYYPNKEWEPCSIFSRDPLVAWNGSLSVKIRTVANVFDAPFTLVFAKAVDGMDQENGGKLDKYNIWSDMQDAIYDMYAREQSGGKFYSELRNNPSQYIYKCNPEVLNWIRKIKQSKKTFLVTGATPEFLEGTTNYALGQDWRSLFDIIVCYAKKPGFFTSDRSFYSLKNNLEDEKVSSHQFRSGEIYSQGNWNELSEFLSNITGKSQPKCLYVGDDLLQDIYAPKKHELCDTVAISDELLVDRPSHDSCDTNLKNDENILVSKLWGSFFFLKSSSGSKDSFWSNIIKKYSKICIPNLEIFTNKPLDEPFKCFGQDSNDDLCGFHPYTPRNPTHQ